MKLQIKFSNQVVQFIQSLPPEPRKKIREGLRKFEEEKGDLKSLEGPLDGYCRLRVMSYRIIFAYGKSDGRRTIFCLYAEKRSLIYEVFGEMVLKKIQTPASDKNPE